MYAADVPVSKYDSRRRVLKNGHFELRGKPVDNAAFFLIYDFLLSIVGFHVCLPVFYDSFRVLDETQRFLRLHVTLLTPIRLGPRNCLGDLSSYIVLSPPPHDVSIPLMVRGNRIGGACFNSSFSFSLSIIFNTLRSCTTTAASHCGSILYR